MDAKELKYQIDTMQKIIDNREKRGEDVTYEKKLVKSWKRYYRKWFGNYPETGVSTGGLDKMA